MSLLRRLALGTTLALTVGFAAAHAAVFDQPVLSKSDGTRASITLNIQAGTSGAPSGFVVEWMTKGDYDRLGGWPLDQYYSGLYYCEFTGTPTLHLELGTSSFALGAGSTGRVVMGSIFDETGLYANYENELAEGADYVFRARAIGDGVTDESANSATLFASTEPRSPTNDCTLTQGFWKTHSASWANVTSMTLGTVNYTHAQLLAIFNTDANGNGLLILAHQLIAAKLNVLFGAVPPPVVVTAISQADALIGGLVSPPIGAGYLTPVSVNALEVTLDDFNNGKIGPDHCADTGGITATPRSTWGAIKALYR